MYLAINSFVNVIVHVRSLSVLCKAEMFNIVFHFDGLIFRAFNPFVTETDIIYKPVHCLLRKSIDLLRKSMDWFYMISASVMKGLKQILIVATMSTQPVIQHEYYHTA